MSEVRELVFERLVDTGKLSAEIELQFARIEDGGKFGGASSNGKDRCMHRACGCGCQRGDD
jgi:hypothetical protein